ncbi:beta-class carbonic anhydrase [Rhabdothermincola sediminis]|uniref:beta-class carbonic anhydrase n=1 Tax=Rhabdothermincola sediminis TaxID=2751370 RepID=UPI001AA07A7C|nr:carbonic anhydrase [Rhabdothermincola sediminis]
MFDDLLAANEAYQRSFVDSGQPGRAARGLAVLTCIDSRIDPLAMLGLKPGDAKIIRNAGARVTDDALRSLVLAANLLGVERVCIVHHTDCAMRRDDESELRRTLTERSGADASTIELLTFPDHREAFEADLRRLRACEQLPPGLVVGGFLFDVHTGALGPIDR